MVTELDDLRRQHFSDFLDAVASDNAPQAWSCLQMLAELQLDVSKERRVYDGMVLRIQLERDICEEHGVFDCPECFSLFDCGDPIDDLEE